MVQPTTKVIMEMVLNLSDLDTDLYANMESFPMTFYRFTDNVHEVSVSNKTGVSLSKFLTINKIPFKKTSRGSYIKESWFEIYVNSDIFLEPNHHIELRVRSIQVKQIPNP
jgi:hypothetical protein